MNNNYGKKLYASIQKRKASQLNKNLFILKSELAVLKIYLFLYLKYFRGKIIESQ